MDATWTHALKAVRGLAIGGCLALVSSAAVCLPVLQPTEWVFVGHVVSSTLTTVPPAGQAEDGGLTISLTCAEAATTYDVQARGRDVPERVIVHSSLGEWCDMPAGIDGSTVLVDAEWEDGAWWAIHAWPLDALRNGDYVLIPQALPEAAVDICGVRLSAVQSPLAAADEILGDASELPTSRVEQLVARHEARIEGDGAVVYTAGVRLDRLFDALPTPCLVPAHLEANVDGGSISFSAGALEPARSISLADSQQ